MPFPILRSLHFSLPRTWTWPWMWWRSKQRAKNGRGESLALVGGMEQPQVLASDSPVTWNRQTPMYLQSPETGFLSFSNKSISNQSHVLCAQLLSQVRLFETPWTVAHQAPLSMGIFQPRILEWVGHALLQGIFPTQGLNPGLQHCGQIL